MNAPEPYELQFKRYFTRAYVDRILKALGEGKIDAYQAHVLMYGREATDKVLADLATYGTVLVQVPELPKAS